MLRIALNALVALVVSTVALDMCPEPDFSQCSALHREVDLNLAQLRAGTSAG